jgi:protein involved in temperature-dependent protein secretion
MSSANDPTRDFVNALEEGDYPRALEAYSRTENARTSVGAATIALLTSLTGDHDKAARQIAGCRDAGLIEAVILGERERSARWSDAKAARELSAAEPLPYLGVYAGMALALLVNDAKFVDEKVAPDARKIPHVGGTVRFVDGATSTFRSIVDSDDGIGAMLETYGPSGLLYIPFASLQSVTFLPPRNFIDRLFYRADVVLTDGTSTTVLVPLLYALSTTAKSPETRAGRTTTWRYVGSARRGLGQRDFVLDGGKMIGMQRFAAIELSGATEPSWTPPPLTQDTGADNAFAGVLKKPWWKFW